MKKSRLDQINFDPKRDWTIALTEPVAFFNKKQSTVAIGVDLFSLSDLIYKPDFPHGVPHITLYDGLDRAFAEQLFSLIGGRIDWRFVLGVSRLRRIEPKRNIAGEFAPFFISFHAMYERIVGNPFRMGEVARMSADRRLDLINEIVRGRPPQREAPPPDQQFQPQRRAVWA